jgi:DNA gyrase subunit A
MQGSTSHILYIFTTTGECATIPVQQIPQVKDFQDGTEFYNLCPLGEKENIAGILSLPANLETGHLFFTTQDAQVKRLRIEDLPGMMSKAFTIMKVSDDVKLIAVALTTGKDEILLTTGQAQAIRFDENDVRPTGLPAGGMKGIKLLGQRDHVVGASVVVEGQYVWCITNDGIAKISPIDQYPTQGRAGAGVITMRLPSNSLEVVAATIGRLDDNIVVLTSKKKPKYMRISLAEEVKRGRSGGKDVIALGEKEAVVEVVNFQPRIITPEPIEET